MNFQSLTVPTDVGDGKPVQITGDGVQIIGEGCAEWGPEPDYVTYVFVFLGSVTICELHKLRFQTNSKSICIWKPVFPIYFEDLLVSSNVLRCEGWGGEGVIKNSHQAANPLSVAVETKKSGSTFS